MTDTVKRLAQATVGTSAAAFYTVPGSTSAIVRHIVAANTSGSATTLIVYHGGSAAANTILPSVSVPAGGRIEFDGIISMAAADTLQAIAGAGSAIQVTVHGMEIT